jgi:hypothetical protein
LDLIFGSKVITAKQPFLGADADSQWMEMQPPLIFISPLTVDLTEAALADVVVLLADNAFEAVAFVEAEAVPAAVVTLVVNGAFGTVALTPLLVNALEVETDRCTAAELTGRRCSVAA